jgi:hypothetical protein
VLIPLITQLLKPEVYQSDPLGMSETRVRAATLLSRVFLHYLVLLNEVQGEDGGFRDLWLKIITIMDRLMNSGQGNNLVSCRPKYGAHWYNQTNGFIGRSRFRKSQEHAAGAL